VMMRVALGQTDDMVEYRHGADEANLILIGGDSSRSPRRNSFLLGSDNSHSSPQRRWDLVHHVKEAQSMPSPTARTVGGTGLTSRSPPGQQRSEEPLFGSEIWNLATGLGIPNSRPQPFVWTPESTETDVDEILNGGERRRMMKESTLHTRCQASSDFLSWVNHSQLCELPRSPHP
jgi:hypothetical protein